MSIEFTDPQYYEDIANAIRSLNGLTRTYLPSEMAQAIWDLEIDDGTLPTLIGLEILSPPDKVEYEIGDAFDSTGLRVKALYTGGYYKYVTDDVNLSIEDGYVFKIDNLISSLDISYTDSAGDTATASIALNIKIAMSINISDRAYGYGTSYGQNDIRFNITDFNKLVITPSGYIQRISSSVSRDLSGSYNILGVNSNGNSTTLKSESISVSKSDSTGYCNFIGGTFTYDFRNEDYSSYEYIKLYSTPGGTNNSAVTFFSVGLFTKGTIAKFRWVPQYGNTMARNGHELKFPGETMVRIASMELLFNTEYSKGITLYGASPDSPSYYNSVLQIKDSTTTCNAGDILTVDFTDIDWSQYNYSSGFYISTSTPIDITYTLHLRELLSIEVTSRPTKTTYTLNETLDLSGAVITAHYTDGTTRDVTTECVFDPANGTELTTKGTNTINVTCTEGVVTTTSFTITVN